MPSFFKSEARIIRLFLSANAKQIWNYLFCIIFWIISFPSNANITQVETNRFRAHFYLPSSSHAVFCLLHCHLVMLSPHYQILSEVKQWDLLSSKTGFAFLLKWQLNNKTKAKNTQQYIHIFYYHCLRMNKVLMLQSPHKEGPQKGTSLWLQ